MSSLKKISLITIIVIGSFVYKTEGQNNSYTTPNIVWIVSEDNSPLIGAYGNDFSTTPNLDSFAKESIIYDNAYANVPVCAPARFTLITGMYASTMGTEHMRSSFNIPDFVHFFPNYLRDKGYYLTNNAKEDYNTIDQPETWDESSEQATYKNRKGNQPFFHVQNINLSHESTIHGEFDTLHHDPESVPVPPYHPMTENVKKDWARYYDQIEKMDSEVGRILEELEAAGLKDDSIIFYFGDHGGALSRGKRHVYESGLNVPLIVHIPEKYKYLVPKGVNGRTDRLVSFVDFAPTVLSLAGINPPEYMQGKPFLGTFNSEPTEYMYASRGRMGERRDLVRAVRDKQYLYRRNYMPNRIYGQYLGYLWRAAHVKEWKQAYDDGQLNEIESRFWEPKPVEELYDVNADPHNVNNLASDPEYQQVINRMRKINKKFIRENKDLGFIPESILSEYSKISSPYEYVRDNNIPINKIVETAEMASRLNLENNAEELLKRLDSDYPSIRYWATQGFVMRSQEASKFEDRLLEIAKDSSPVVQIAVSEVLYNLGEQKKAMNILERGLESDQEMIRLQALQVLTNLDLNLNTIPPFVAKQIRRISDKERGGFSGGYDIAVARRLVEVTEL